MGRVRVEAKILHSAGGEINVGNKGTDEYDSGIANKPSDSTVNEKNEQKDKAKLKTRMQKMTLGTNSKQTLQDTFNDNKDDGDIVLIEPNLGEEQERFEIDTGGDQVSNIPLSYTRRPHNSSTHTNLHQSIKAQTRNDNNATSSNRNNKNIAKALLMQTIKADYKTKLKLQESDPTDNITKASLFKADFVDDSDTTNPKEDYYKWQVRELERCQRDRQARLQSEFEKIEMERIRNMTFQEREQFDAEKEASALAARPPPSQMKYMQKYYHKGAFYSDALTDKLASRDYTQATGQDANVNREILPEIKQVRDYGLKGRTKWTHLVNEDTTGYHYGWGRKREASNYKLLGKMGGMKNSERNDGKRRR